MIDREKVIKGLQCLARTKEPTQNPCKDCGYVDRPNFAICVVDIANDALELLREQQETIVTLAMNKENAEQTRESIKPAVDEFGNAYCICATNVGFIPQNDRRLPKMRFNYCPDCGRKLVWE